MGNDSQYLHCLQLGKLDFHTATMALQSSGCSLSKPAAARLALVCKNDKC